MRLKKMLLTVTLLCMLALPATQATAAISFEAPVKHAVGAEPRSIAYQKLHNELYVACYGSSEIWQFWCRDNGTLNFWYTNNSIIRPNFVTEGGIYTQGDEITVLSNSPDLIHFNMGYQVQNAGPDPRSICFDNFNDDPGMDAVAVYHGFDAFEIFRYRHAYWDFFPDGGVFTGAGPISVCSADFTGDGKNDVAVANYYGQTVTVYRNTSIGADISFVLHATNGTGPLPFYICTADFDGDGLPDLATCDNGYGVTVLRNTGGGIFTGSEQGTGRVDSPTCILAADFDKDGKPDLAIANSAGGYGGFVDVTVLRNTCTPGNISFEVGSFVNDGGSGAYSLCAGDFNNDGQIDLAVANRYSNDISILLNNTSGVCGDANGDAAVNISDAVYLIAYIFAGGPTPNPLLSGDANCDLSVNISDAVYLIAYIFAGGPVPCAACK